MRNTQRLTGLRILFGSISIALLVVAALLVLIAHQGGPPPWISLTMIMLPLALFLCAVDCLTFLRHRLRLSIAVFTGATACVYVGLTCAMLFGWVKGDFGFTLIPALWLIGYLGIINRPWRRPASDQSRGP